MTDEGRATGSLERGHGGRPARGAPDHAGPTYAALDLGTNNCRLLVARPAGDSFRVIDAFSRIIRLGEGVSRSGRISEAAIERAVEALAVCRDKMRNRGVTRARLIATEACRAAENSVEFRARIAEKVGLDLEVIDRQTEATLAATGCTPLMDPYADGVILFDIGGGSSELVRLDRSPQCRRGPPLREDQSVDFAALRGGHAGRTPWGARRHSGNLCGHDRGGDDVRQPVRGRARRARLRAYASSGHVGNGDHNCGRAPGAAPLRAASGGRLLDGQRRGNARHPAAACHELRGPRRPIPCIGAERADLVLAGCAILDAIRSAFPCRRLRVADRGLREGMLVQMMREDRVWGGSGESWDENDGGDVPRQQAAKT